MTIFPFQQKWRRSILVILIALVCGLSALANVQGAGASAKLGSPLETFHEKDGKTPYKVLVYRYPKYSYDEKTQTATIDVGLIHLQKKDKYYGSIEGTLKVVKNQRVFVNVHTQGLGAPKPNNIVTDITFDPKGLALPTTNYCSVYGRSIVEAPTGDQYYNEDCGRFGPYVVNTSFFYGTAQRIATHDGTPGNDQFKVSVNNERKDFADLKTEARTSSLALPNALSRTKERIALGLGIFGMAAVLGGTVAGALCIGTDAPSGQCLGEWTHWVLFTGAVTAAFGGVFLLAGGGQLGHGIIHVVKTFGLSVAALIARLMAYYSTQAGGDQSTQTLQSIHHVIDIGPGAVTLEGVV